jgi:hypothetical protein
MAGSITPQMLRDARQIMLAATQHYHELENQSSGYSGDKPSTTARSADAKPGRGKGWRAKGKPAAAAT